MTSTTIGAPTAIAAFYRFFATAACTHLIFHGEKSVMMMETFVVAAHMETFTST